jgi:hypothetical protein
MEFENERPMISVGAGPSHPAWLAALVSDRKADIAALPPDQFEQFAAGLWGSLTGAEAIAHLTDQAIGLLGPDMDALGLLAVMADRDINAASALHEATNEIAARYERENVTCRAKFTRIKGAAGHANAIAARPSPIVERAKAAAARTGAPAHQGGIVARAKAAAAKHSKDIG